MQGRDATFATIKAVGLAGDAWQSRRVSAVGSTEAVVAEMVARLSGDLSTADASTVLGVSTRRIGQLVGDGTLSGRKIGTSWILDAATVYAEA